MTEENRRRNVGYEWDRASESLGEVDDLIAGRHWAAAISRAYYGVFYLSRALIFSLGMEARTHGGLIHLISEHLVRTGHFPAELLRVFSIMQRQREDADYQTAILHDEESAMDAKASLLRFREAAEHYLRKEGFLT